MKAQKLNDEEAYRQASPTSTSRRYMPQNKTDLFFCFGSVATIILGKMLFGSIMMILLLALFCFMMMVSQQGRFYTDLANICRDVKLTIRQGNILFRSNDVKRKRIVMPIVAGQMGPTGFIFVPSTGEISQIIVGAGSDTSSKDLSGQFSDHASYAELVVDTSNTAESSAVSISSIFRRRPLDKPQMETMLRSNLHPGVLAPHLDQEVPELLRTFAPNQWADLTADDIGVPREEWPAEVRRAIRRARQHRVFDELIGVSSKFGGEVDMAYILTMVDGKLRDRAEEARKSGEQTVLKKSDVERLEIEAARQALLDGMVNSGVSNPRTLDYSQVRRFIRAGWDIVHAGDYHSMLEEGNDNDLLHWPQKEISVTDKSLITDGTHHSVLKVINMPAYPTPADLRPIFAVNVPWLTVACVTETSSSAVEVRMSDKLMGMVDAFSEGYGRNSQSRTSRDRKEEINNRTERIHSAKFRTDYVVYMCVSASSADELDKYCKQARRQLKKFGMKSVRIRRKTAQLPYFLASTTGINLA